MRRPIRFGLIGLAAAAIAVPVIVNATAGAEEPDAVGAEAVTELAVNGTFANGTTGWWNGGNTTMSVVNGALAVNVTGGTNYWDAPIGQDGVKLTSGTSYTISFDAKASAAKTVRSTVQLNAAPYTAPHDKTVNLTTSMQHFSYTFTSNVTTTTGQIDFQLGNGSSYTFTVDNVSLTTGSGDVDPDPSDPVEEPAGDFFVDPDNNAKIWYDKNEGDQAVRTSIYNNIVTKAGAKWFGDWSGYGEAAIQSSVDAYVDKAAAAGRTPILAAYNIYGRDCGGYSGGGPTEAAHYEAWIRGFSKGIAGRKAIVILEPDAVAQMLTCGMSESAKTTRRNLLTYATQQLKANSPNAWTYIDAGNPGWIPAGQMADGLESVGIANTRGFAINVSNYKTTGSSTDYGTQINANLPTAKKFVVDTSRNGSTNTDGDWCNSRGAKLGVNSQWSTGPAEALLWVKFPGDSDGECTHTGRNDPPAGQFVPAYAQALITGNWSGV